MTVVHYCPDGRVSSGINTFCTKLDRRLRAIGVDSGVLRHFDLKALEKARAERPGLVLHLHEMWLPSVHRMATWARRNGVPVVWSTHGMTAPWSLRHKRWKKLPIWWLCQRRDLKNAAVIHCTSEQEAAWNEKLGLKNWLVVPLGTDEPATKPPCRTEVSAAREKAGFRVLFVGRIHPVKGLLNLVRAAGLLVRSEGKASDRASGFSFRIVGPDEDGHRAELEAECRRLGVANVEFVGERRGADLSAEYEGCDILVLPSFTENFGGVVIDALAHGKPVIASRYAPWRELAERGCGWWVDNSPESLARTIAEAAALPRERLGAMGAEGRKLVEAKYTWEAVAKAMKAGYEAVEGAGET